MCLMKGVVYVLKYLKLPKDVVAVSYKEISRSDKENVELSYDTKTVYVKKCDLSKDMSEDEFKNELYYQTLNAIGM